MGRSSVLELIRRVEMGVLLVHGAGYQSDPSLRFLQRQRLRAGLISGFIAAKKVEVATALNEDLSSAPFEVRFVEYSQALNQRPRGIEPPPAVEHAGRTTWEEQRKLRCLCCPRTSRVRTNVRTWTGTTGQSLQKVTSAVIKRRLPDVHRYLTREEGRGEAIRRVSQKLQDSVDVVIAHSLGSIVTIDALARVADDSSPKLLVTIGSPLRFDAVREQLDVATSDWIRRRPATWINVHDRGDVVTAGGGLPRRQYPGVINIAVNNGDHQHAGDYYLRHAIVGALVWDVAAGNVSVEDLGSGLPAAFGTMVKYPQ